MKPGDLGAADLNNKRLLSFYTPLALSWLCMAAEAPICLAVISRSVAGDVKAAAFHVVMAIAIFIEAPVIDLLSTSTTLCRTRSNFEVLRKFVLWLILWVTVLHSAVVFTPLYDLVTLGLLNLKPEVAEAAHQPLQILALWSAAIGWRRWLQGILIRAGETKAISIGTLMRVVTVGLFAFGLHFGFNVDGPAAAAIGLMASVAVESLFIHWISRDIIRESVLGVEDGDHLTMGDLAKFHFPLTASTSVTLMTGPLLAWALAASPNPIQNAAAFSLASSLIWLFRTATFALPEVVIALSSEPASRPILLRFCLQVGGALTFIMAAFWAFGLDEAWISGILGAKPELIPLAKMAFLLCLSFPLLGAAASAMRGFLTAARETQSRLWAIGAYIVTMALVLIAGVSSGQPGIVTVCLALLAAQIAELASLAFSWHRVQLRAG